MKAGLTGFALLLALASLLFLIVCPYVLATAAAAQKNNRSDTDLVKAFQDASQNDSEYLRAKVSIEGFELSAEIPVTSELMSKGLSVKNQLRENESMLFVFEEPARHSFWMKDMKFPIDIIWLDSNGKTVHIEENLMPCPMVLICPSYAPNSDSQYVLETIAGFAQRHNISVGTNIKFELMR
jgi:uncharacterized protein